MRRIQILLCILSLSFFIGKTQTIIYVDSSATGLNNGSSWTNAYNFIQDAVTGAKQINNASVIYIWIANGTYFPDDGSKISKEDREAFIELESNIHLYGGFNGSEKSILERNIDTVGLQTIISGDIGFKNYQEDNSNNLLKGYNVTNVVIDGIKFTNAYSIDVETNWMDQTVRWGSIYFEGSDITIQNCYFVNNLSNYNGGAINIKESQIEILGCIFNSNTSSNAKFFGSSNYEIFLNNLGSYSNFNATINKCRFDTTEMHAIYNDGDLLVKGSYFTKIGGKALKVGYFAQNTLLNSTFENIISSSSIIDEMAYHDQLIINNCKFNNITNYGTIIESWCKEEAPDIISNCIFSNNKNIRGTGVPYYPSKGICMDASGPIYIVNSIFVNNQSEGAGGAVYLRGEGSANIINSLFYNNKSVVDKNGHAIHTEHNLRISNSIIWNNSVDSLSISKNNSSVIAIKNSIYNENIVEHVNSGNNFYTDPLLNDPDGVDNIFGTVDDNYYASTNSNVLDNGDNNSLDINGDWKIDFIYDFACKYRFFQEGSVQPIVDIGPVENGSLYSNSKPSVNIPDFEINKDSPFKIKISRYILDNDFDNGDTVNVKFITSIPSWIHFNSDSLILSGIATSELLDVNSIELIVSVSDRAYEVTIDTFKITVLECNTINNFLSDTSICIGDTIEYSSGINFSSYEWSDGQQTETILLLKSDTIFLNGTDESGCVHIDSAIIKVNELPILNLADTIYTYSDTTIILNAGNWEYYDWSTGETSSTITINLNQQGAYEYSVYVSDINNCSNSDTTIIIHRPTSMIVNNFYDHVTIYPNPSNSMININTSKIDGKFSIQLYSVEGKFMLNKNGEGQNKVTLNISDFKKGIYYLIISSKENDYVNKIVIK